MTTAPTIVRETPDLVTVIQAYNDVTERLKRSHEQLAREVCRLRDELQEKNKELERRTRLASLGQMAAGVAHEIRNPLGGIGIYASLLERDLADRPEQADIVRKIRAGVRNMETIVSDILAFGGDAEPRQRRTIVGDLLEEVLSQTAPQADALGVTVDVDDALLPAECFVDGKQIERALINLLLNAVDAVGAGGHVWIRNASCAGDGVLRLSVEDNGVGISAGDIQRVFDPFFTTKESGTGLGLAIVHRIAESNGGSVSVRNRSDGGAAFVLSVPISDDGTSGSIMGGDE